MAEKDPAWSCHRLQVKEIRITTVQVVFEVVALHCFKTVQILTAPDLNPWNYVTSMPRIIVIFEWYLWLDDHTQGLTSWISCQDLRKILNSWISWKDLRFCLDILNFLVRSWISSWISWQDLGSWKSWQDLGSWISWQDLGFWLDILNILSHVTYIYRLQPIILTVIFPVEISDTFFNILPCLQKLRRNVHLSWMSKNSFKIIHILQDFGTKFSRPDENY